MPSTATVRYWVRKFKCGDESLAGAPRSEHPISAIDECLIEEIRRAIVNNRKIGIRTLAQATNSSYGTVHKIIHEYLGLEKKFAKWIPYNLNESQLEKRVKICREFLREFSRDFHNIKERIITSDETWVYFETPESANTSREWVDTSGPAPTRERLSP